MKRKFFFKLFVFAVIAAFATVTSCKDYDDDINNLQKQLTDLKATITELTTKIGEGATIKDVQNTDDGIVITLSNGKTYPIKHGTNGTGGSNGTNGSVVSIGSNGNWFIDGVDTGKPSQGPKGDQGNAGGEGKDGKYYVPGEDGFWILVENGVETKTTQKWMAPGGITAKWENGYVVLYNVEGMDEPVVIGLVALKNLVLIPDFVADEGGALPVINFSPLKTSCGEIAPAALVRYQVSPTNATEKLIDKDNISFKYNGPAILRSSKINPKAEFVSLTGGVLTVRASIDTKELYSAADDKIDQLMLVVPSVSGTDDVISDWAKVVSSPIDDIALVRKPAIAPPATNWPTLQLPSTLNDAKALAKTHPTVVDLAYDETLDLLEVVKTMIKKSPWSDFNIDTYNLEYAFDLNDLNGDKIVYEVGGNKTDQQKFLNLVGSQISTRVYDIDGANPASVDRTPIVHVFLKSKDGGSKCNVLDGFIKINIVEAKVEPVAPIVIDGGTTEAGCKEYKVRVGTKEMNEQFYAKAKVSKQFFHDNFVWAELTGGVGTITEVQDPNDTESYNLVWTVSAAELAKNVDKTIEKSGTYTFGSNVIAVTFKLKVTKPEINLGGIMLENYWDSSKSYFVLNSAVPTSGATNPDECTFDVNINNAFKTNADKMLDLKSINAKYANYTYEYFFDKKENQPVKTYNGIVISVSADSKELLATKGGVTETVATIQAQAAGTGDIISYNENSDLGKELLNVNPEFMKARLYIKVKNECGQDVVVKGFNAVKAFDVHFLRPVNVEGKAADNFVDGVDFGEDGSFINVKDVVRLSDWRNYALGTDTYYFDPNHENYYDYYDVIGITIDVNNIKPKGLIIGGVEATSLPSTLVVEQTAPDAANPYGQLTYLNNGAKLKDDFTMIVPVQVEYKWGKVTTTVEVLVKAK